MIVPDSIEPLEMFRGWKVVQGRLCSLMSGQVWEPGEAFHASCSNGATQQWGLVRRGVSLEVAKQRAKQHNQWESTTRGMRYGGPYVPPSYVTVPSVEPPAGFGYVLESVTHDAPHEGCTCGVYAVSEPSGVPPSMVLGKVKLWGKVVPGDAGARAEFAYPSELTVPRGVYQDGLEDYGVPVDVIEDADAPPGTFVVGPSFYRRKRSLLWLAAFNGASAGANVGLMLSHLT